MADQTSPQAGALDEPRRTSIAAALQTYRDAVLGRNLTTLRILVQGLAKSYEKGFLEKDARAFRLEAFTDYYLQAALPESVTEVDDLLCDSVREEMVSTHWLDGVDHSPVNRGLRTAWFANVQARVAARDDDAAVRVAPFPPPDLEYLCTIASGITGPGLFYHQLRRQITFIDAIGPGNVNVDEEAVLTKADPDLEWVWDEWDIAVACRLGQGPGPEHDGLSLALYCRQDDEAPEWGWRYGLCRDDWCSDIYDTVEQFLDFYAHFREQTEEQAENDVKKVGRR